MSSFLVEINIKRQRTLQLTVDLVTSENGQNVLARKFVVRELRREAGPVPTLLLLTVVQIVREKLRKHKLAISEIVPVG